MAAKDIFNGSTGNRATFLILDNATGLPKTGVAWNAAGLSISYRIGTGSAVSITLTSGNWFEVGAGKYYVDVADSVYAAGNLGALVQFYGALTSSSVYGEQHRVVAYNPLAVAVGANTTTPPTAAANADAVWDEAYNQHTTAGTFGKLLDILRKANNAIEATITSDVTPTASTFSVNLTAYPTGAFVGSVLMMIDGNRIDQNSPILTFTNNTTFSTIVLESPLTGAPAVGDTILIDATSHVHSVAEIVTGVWSALTSGLSVVGSTGRALARLIGLVQDNGGDEFTVKALNRAPSGSSTVTVLPASGIAAGRGETTSLVAYVGETISQSIGVYQSDGTTAYDLSGKTLTIIFENLKTGDDVAVVASGSITISGANNNTVTFAYPSAATASQRELGWVLRDEAAPKTVYLRGTLEVRYAPTVG